MKLKKELSLFSATLYGVGIILGAGIYVLIGQGAGVAGNAIWLSFIVASLIAFFTGLSYAELAGMYQKSAAEYVYMKHAFNKNYLSFIVQWVMIISLVVSASTVALGFGNYFSHLFGIEPGIAAVILLAILSVLSYIGIKESAQYNTISTLIEVSGLILVIAIGVFFVGKAGINYLESPNGLAGILSATTVIFFAYIGFEGLVNLSEETKSARKIIPKALVLSLIVSTTLFTLVSLSSVAILGADALSKSPAPLTDVVSVALPQAGILMSVIALFATSNTVLAILIVASRMLYGLACNNALPSMFCKIGSRQTPYISISIIMLLSIAFLLLGDIKTIALLTDIGIFMVYISVNLCLIVLRYKEPNRKRTFASPVNIGRFPVLAFLGIVSSLLMMLHFEITIVLYQILIVIIGFLFYEIFAKLRNP